MTTTTDKAFKASVKTVASMLVESEDLLEGLDALSELLKPEAFYAVCLAVEACPIHATDIQVCMDDNDPECRAHRDAHYA